MLSLLSLTSAGPRGIQRFATVTPSLIGHSSTSLFSTFPGLLADLPPQHHHHASSLKTSAAFGPRLPPYRIQRTRAWRMVESNMEKRGRRIEEIRLKKEAEKKLKAGHAAETAASPLADAASAAATASSSSSSVLSSSMGVLGDAQSLKRIGAYALGFHAATWVATFGAMYGVVAHGVEPPQFMMDLLPASVAGTLDTSTLHGRAAFALALTVVTGPARHGLDLAALPFITAAARKHSAAASSSAPPEQ